ncbi:hypothetical protein [Campylobacter porcelli]|uniref:hypothetical protein n=1 Tax=Campylobacter porcelli TaxID=1660073 RepID=UPI000A34721B|nr:hypothetical protein [Campylobacter sp. P0078]
MSGLISWIRGFLTTLYISVIIKDNKCHLFSRAIKGDKIINSGEAVFDINNGVVDSKFTDYLKKRARQYHTIYLAAMLNSPKQWALPAVGASEFEKFNIEYNLVDKVKLDGWSIVVPDNELELFENSLSVKPDLIYSPFAILHSLIKESPSDGKILYLLNMEDSNTIMIFDGDKMKFGAYFDNRKEIDTFDYYDKAVTKEESADLDNVIEEEEDRLSQLDNLGDIGSFDSFDDGDLDKSDFEDIRQENIGGIDKKLEDSVRDIGEEITLISNIKLAINEYYHNEIYGGDFIKEIVIFDGLSLDNEFLVMAENDLMIECKVVKYDIDKILNNIMIKEICDEL